MHFLIRLQTSHPNAEISLNYPYLLSAAIYKIIAKGDAEYAQFLHEKGYTLEYLLQSNIGWMIDDVATEEVYKEFGNTIDVIEKIISQRYMLADRIPFDSMHLTSNLSEEMLSKRYGPRFMSRLYDMFNIIIINGKDWRRA